MQQPKEIIVAGTGRLASALVPALQENNAFKVFCWGRDAGKTKEFASNHDASILTESSVTRPVILCVSDSAVADVAKELAAFAECLVHTSGNCSIDLLKPFNKNVGVMWPVQTFTENRVVDWKEIPLLIEFSGADTENFLKSMSDQLGGPVEISSTEKRRQMHLAAVFVNNFWNHLAVLGDQWCEVNGLDGKLLLPLMKETAAKLNVLKPAEAQTGPARRHDTTTLAAHVEMLKNFPELNEVYRLLSAQIGKRFPNSQL